MAAGITIDIKDGASPVVRRMIETFTNPVALLNVLGREASNMLRAWFRQKDQTEPSQLGLAGGRRSHFWLEIMRSISSPRVNPADPSVTISITDPRFAQKLYGGPIYPKRAKWLTIPVDPESYNRRASVFEAETGMALKFIGARGGAVLATEGRHGILHTRYVLRRSVRQEPDPKALPDQSVLEDVMRERAETYIKRKLEEK